MWTKIKLIGGAILFGILAFLKIRGDRYYNKYNKIKQDLKEGELKAREGHSKADLTAKIEGDRAEVEDVKKADSGSRNHFNNDF